MTPAEIRAAVAESPALQAFVAASNWTAAAAALTAAQPRRVVTGRTITTRGAAAGYPALGGLPGALAFQLAHRKLVAFAAAAKASANVPTSLLGEAIELQLTSFRDLGLDFGEPALRAMLDLIVTSGGITAEEAQGFKDLALVDAEPVAYGVVAAAMQET